MKVFTLCSILTIGSMGFFIGCKKSDAEDKKVQNCEKRCARPSEGQLSGSGEGVPVPLCPSNLEDSTSAPCQPDNKPAAIAVAELLNSEGQELCIGPLVSPRHVLFSTLCLASQGEKEDRTLPDLVGRFQLRVGDRTYELTARNLVLAHEFQFEDDGQVKTLVKGAPVALLELDGRIEGVKPLLYDTAHPEYIPIVKASYDAKASQVSLRAVGQEGQFFTQTDFYYRGTALDDGGLEHFGLLQSMEQLCPIQKQAGIFLKHRADQTSWELLAIPIMPFTKGKACLESDGILYLRLAKNNAALRILNQIQEWEG